jgi:uncharacterized protein YraI
VAAAVVNFSGDAALVPAARVVAADATPTTVPSPTPTVPVVVGTVEALDAINVRSAPSTDSDILGGMYLGETFDVLSVSEDGDWWQIDFGGELAWVAAEFVRFTGDKNNVPIFGVATATPTSEPTNTPVSTATATPFVFEQPTLAPTPTSEYQATSAALLAERTPEPAGPSSSTAQQDGGFGWSSIPWGILAIVVIAGFLWYQFVARRHRRR